MLTVPKYPRTMHHPASPGLQNDDRVCEYPDEILNQPVIITEKIDGGNTCLFNGEVYARSTGQPSTAGWFAMVRKHHAWKTIGDTNRFYYGEDIFGVHSITYDPIPEDETYRLFGVLDQSDPEQPHWLSWEETEATAEEKGMKTVPVLFSGTFANQRDLVRWFEDQIKLPSSLGGEREGFVIRSTDRIKPEEFSTCVMKFVRSGHVQTDQHWKMNWKPCKFS